MTYVHDKRPVRTDDGAFSFATCALHACYFEVVQIHEPVVSD
jgi:hypothetical protein